MTVKDKRREVRVSANDDDLLVEAAGIAGVSVSEFVLGRALSEAEALVQAHRTITLGTSAYEKFLEALDSPPQPIDALGDQIHRSRRLKRSD